MKEILMENQIVIIAILGFASGVSLTSLFFMNQIKRLSDENNEMKECLGRPIRKSMTPNLIRHKSTKHN